MWSSFHIHVSEFVGRLVSGDLLLNEPICQVIGELFLIQTTLCVARKKELFCAADILFAALLVVSRHLLLAWKSFVNNLLLRSNFPRQS